MTVSDLITATLVLLGVYSPSDTVAPEDYAITLNGVNLLIESWNAAILKSMTANYGAARISAWNAAVQKSMAANYNNLIEAWNAAASKSLSSAYDPSLFTFNAMSTSALYTFNPITVAALFTFHAVSDLVNPGDVISLPAGWTRALQYNTALDVAPIFSKIATDDIKTTAADSKAAILTPGNSEPAFGETAEQLLAAIPPASATGPFNPALQPQRSQ